MTAETIYHDLQKHLDKQPVGYPATKSGIELRLLKQLFEPEEARLTLLLSYKHSSLEQISAHVKEKGLAFGDLESMLDRMMKKGLIGHAEKEGVRYFFTLPLIVGIYEMQLENLTPEFLADFKKYTSNRAFGLEFLGTELPQMRTIPVNSSIEPEHHVATYDQVTDLITQTGGPFVIIECICRKTSRIKGEPCEKTDRRETCMALGDMASNLVRAEMGREISLDEALDIARQNEAEGLVFQPSNTQNAEFLCSCCGCCCGMLGIQKALPRPVDFWATNFQAAVDAEACSGCELCVERCQVDTVSMDEDQSISVINLNRCIGCGNCVSTCPEEAIQLVKRDKEVAPPESLEELYDIIMANKKGRLGKLKLAAKLISRR
jgi:H+/Na+-translocating ferredoxin:NAD+ oxidoreductase subunit B